MGKKRSRRKPSDFYDMMQVKFPEMSRDAIKEKLRRKADIVFLEDAKTVMQELKKRKAEASKELSTV